jgi:membrane protein
VVGLMETPRGRLGWATVFSLSVAFYSARAGVAALIQGMDFVHKTQPRGLIWGWAVDFILTGALIVALIVALGTVVVMPVMLAYVGSDSFDAFFLKGLPWAAMFLLVLTCLGILYRYGPNYGPDFRGALTPWVTPGTFFAALAWAAVSIAFSAYLANFNSYNRIYGSIGAVIALLMWLYLSVWTVLMGAAINAELSQRHRKKKGGNLPPDPHKM